MDDYLLGFSGEYVLKLSAQDAEYLAKRQGFNVLSVEPHEDGWLIRVDDLGLGDTYRTARQDDLMRRLKRVDLELVWWSWDDKFFVVNVPRWWHY